jgi:hypothetical protein
VSIPARIGTLLLLVTLALACVACGEAVPRTTAVISTAASGAATRTTTVNAAAVSTTRAPSAAPLVAASTTSLVANSTTSDAASAAGPPHTQSEITGFGQEAQVGDWKVEVVSVTWKADSAVADNSEFNDLPEAGYQYVLVKIRAVRTGEEAGSFADDVYCAYQGSDGDLFHAALQDVPEAIGDAEPVEQGRTATGNVVFQVSSQLVSGGRLVMEPSSSSAGSRVVFILD